MSDDLEQAITAAKAMAETALTEAQKNLKAAQDGLAFAHDQRLKVIRKAREVFNDQDIAHILGISTRSLAALFRSPRAEGAPRDVDVVDGRTGEALWDAVPDSVPEGVGFQS